MARDFFINGPSMVYVKGRSDVIPPLTELGLTDAPIRARPQFFHKPIKVDAWGEAAPEIQFMLAHVDITMSLISFDRDVLDACLRMSMGGVDNVGQLSIAGQRLGNGKPLFHPGANFVGNHFVQVSISSPYAGKPWRFFACYMSGPPMDFPLGTEKSAVAVNWRCIPYDVNLYNGGSGSNNLYLWDHASVA